ncbi:MAG: Aminopeptidase N [Chlorobi bacterium OLB5]|nr:MAG: Aminopeptidase N [Chlorobi bacterium OLB5]
MNAFFGFNHFFKKLFTTLFLYKILIFVFLNFSLYGQWVPVYNQIYTFPDDIQFINQNTGFCTAGLGAKKSTNGGLNWSYMFSYESGVYPRALYFPNQNFGCIVCQSGVYLTTTNSGTNWTLRNHTDSINLADVKFINTFTGWATGAHAATGGYTDQRIIKTTNSGLNWIPQYYDFYYDYYSICFINDQTGFVGGQNGRLLKTTNSGITWILKQSNTSQSINSIYFVSDGIGWFGDNYGKIFKTTNYGENWTLIYSGSVIYGIGDIFFINPLKGWAVGTYNRIIYTSNGGNNWMVENLGPYDEYLSSVFFINDSIGWASGYRYILKTTNGGIPVGILQINGTLPVEYSLSQNYPNPFNPQTKIKFDIPANVKGQTTNVKLVIYDLLGREVTTLVNEELKPGTYEADWDGSNFSSGVYFYKIITEGFVETKKMILMK